MSRFVNRLGLALILFVAASNAWALGLGEIRLQSALNQPLQAEIQLLSATPEELAVLTVSLASAETFARYGIDRPAYLTGVQFDVVNGGSDGSYVRVTSRQPMTEPFLTFLVEASWARGRLLREYTVLLDPPTFAPPQPARQAVTAPQRAEPRDSGTIQRPAEPTPEPAPAPAPVTRAPVRQAEPVSEPAPVQEPLDETDKEPTQYVPPSFSQADASDYTVAQSQTLWGIAVAVRPDSGLTINQVMLAIYEANPEAFGGNINILKAGATLRIPSADDMYSIDRGSARAEAQRQHDSWDGADTTATDTAADDEYEPYEPYEPEPEPAVEAEDSSSLTLVPPDEEPVGLGTGADDVEAEVELSREDEILNRIDAIEAEEIPVEQSLIDIRNDELARLRQELADIRGEVYEPPVAADDTAEAPDPFVDVEAEATDEAADEAPADDAAAEPVADEPVAEEPAPTNRIIQQEPQPGIVDQVLGALTSMWTLIIAGVVVLVGGILFFFMRGRSKDDEASESWSPLDADDDVAFERSGSTQTQSIPPPEAGEETIVVEEAPAAMTTADTIEVEMPGDSSVEFAPADDSGDEPDMMEDTFSSETAVNLDQSDPIAEADFHMAYGLYDQAADLVNGALQADPENRELLTKLCEIYFVWGNRDAFIDAAQRVKSASGGDSAEWDKIVIMGQQIAGDSELFAGADVAGATKEVDLTFDSADDAGGGDLDMVFGDEEAAESSDDGGIDFLFDGDDSQSSVDENLEITAQTPTIESTLESTAEMPTMETDLADSEGTTSLPAIDEALATGIEEAGMDSDATAEIDLDDLGLDLDALDSVADSLDSDDEMEITGSHDALADTGINEAIPDLEETGKNEQLEATGRNEALEESGVDFVLDTTGVHPPGSAEDTDVGVDFDILAATGKTQVLPDQMKVETINEPGPALGDDMETMLAGDLDEAEGGKEHTGTEVLGDDMETMLAGDLDALDSDTGPTGTEVLGDNDATMLAPSPTDEDFDFAKTEALPPTVMDDDDATAETPALASTDMDLDLDDLTAALDLSEIGDTAEMIRDDATVEQPRPPMGDPTAEMPSPSFGEDDDLSEARTMTEVGTKLDLARAYVDMGDPGGARSILEEVLDEGDDDQRKQAQDLLDSLPG